MISSYVAVVGTLAALQAVSAQRTEAGQVLQRLENRLEIGDECHPPLGSYVLSKPGQPTMPPCVAQQAISSACEALTNVLVPQSDPAQAAANHKAYRQCLTGPGSSYRQDVMGCLACKEQHNKLSRAQYDYWVSKYSFALDVFASNRRRKKDLWNYVQTTIDWGHYDKLVKPSPGVKVPAKPIAEYYPQPPKVQGLGTFTYNNRTYPEAALRDQGLLLEESVERLDPVGVLVDAQVKAAAPSSTQSQPPALHTTLVRVVSSSKLPAGNGSVHASSTLLAVSSSKLPVGTGSVHTTSTPLAVSSSRLPVGTGSVRANPTPLDISSSKLAGTGSVRANSTLLAASRSGARPARAPSRKPSSPMAPVPSPRPALSALLSSAMSLSLLPLTPRLPAPTPPGPTRPSPTPISMPIPTPRPPSPPPPPPAAPRSSFRAPTKTSPSSSASRAA